MSILLDAILTTCSSGHPESKLWGIAPNPYKSMPTVHLNDVEPVAIVNPDFVKGPWIAGGAPLRWYQGVAVGSNDIDVFCKNAVQAQHVIAEIKQYGRYNVKHESENASTLEYWDVDQHKYWTVQVITKRYFASMQEVLDGFDLSVCQIGTCGTEWLLGQSTAKDIREKNLRFVNLLQPQSPKRLIKYWAYGYRPVPGTLESLTSDPEISWEFSNDEEYNNAF
jgi:hypothetical protein